MTADQLTPSQRAVLLTLMASARELTNAEVQAVAGTFRRDARDALNDLKLVTSRKEGRTFVHELTDDGWARCREELLAERPARSGVGGAVYAVLAGLDRYLEREDKQLSDVFRPDVQAQVRGAYLRVAGRYGEWVGLADLRAALDGVPRDDVDTALERLASQPGVHVQGETNQQALTDADRAAALRLGGADRHAVKIEGA